MKLTWREQLELDEWLARWSPSIDVEDLVRCSIGRIAIKELGRVRAKESGPGLGMWSALPNDRVAQHIVDWLTADFIDCADWIERVDDKGRPLKLMKCGSMDQLTHEADKAMRRRLQGKNVTLGERDETVVAELAEGFTVVRLLTALALDLESKRMRHCVGHGSYDHGVAEGLIEIYSLRDPEGGPCVTIEVEVSRFVLVDDEVVLAPDDGRSKEVVQVQGPANSLPVREHMDTLKPFLRDFVDWKDWYPIVTDTCGREHDADRIPPGTTFDSLNFMTVSRLPYYNLVLPERLTVLGELDLREACVRRLPEGLKVGGNLNLGDNVITEWPSDMEIGGCILGGVNCVADLIPAYVVAKMDEAEKWKLAETARLRETWNKWLSSDQSLLAGMANIGLGVGLTYEEATADFRPRGH